LIRRPRKGFELGLVENLFQKFLTACGQITMIRWES
jgi:hypothetical protein